MEHQVRVVQVELQVRQVLAEQVVLTELRELQV